MHEFSFASHIANVVIQNVKKAGVEKVLEVKVEIGAFTMIIPSYLEYCYNIVKENYPELKESTLVLTQAPGKIQCEECAEVTVINIDRDEEPSDAGSLKTVPALDHEMFTCSKCKSTRTKIVGGKEALIKSMKVDD